MCGSHRFARWQIRCIDVRVAVACIEALLIATPHRPQSWALLAVGTAQCFRRQSVRDDDLARSAARPNARSVVVPSNVVWTNTGINVTRGKTCASNPQARSLSFNGDDIAAPPVPRAPAQPTRRRFRRFRSARSSAASATAGRSRLATRPTPSTCRQPAVCSWASTTTTSPTTAATSSSRSGNRRTTSLIAGLRAEG